MTVVTNLSRMYDLDDSTTLIDQHAGGCMPVKIIKPRTAGPHPVVILLMGMTGVDLALCSIGRLIAEEGYAVAIPDLYHDAGSKASALPADFDEALEAMHGIREQRAMDDIGATLEFIASRGDMNTSRISLFGHCLGGRLSLVAASYFPTQFRCIASYYASGLETCLSAFGSLDIPTQIVGAGKSLFACEQALGRVEANLRQHNQFVERLSYAEASHNFLDAGCRNYDPVLAADALYRTFNFIAANTVNDTVAA